MTSVRPTRADGVVMPHWGDRPPGETFDVALAADELGFSEIWVGEMATFDAFALGAVIASRTRHSRITVGPLAVHLRQPVGFAMGVSSVSELGGRAAHLALGTSSPAVVERWHGRCRTRPATTLRETVMAVKPILAGHRSGFDGVVVRTEGFRLHTTLPDPTVTVAAFGPEALRVAAEAGDRLLLNLVSPDVAGRLVADFRAAAADVDRPAPPAAVWVVAAVDPTEAGLRQIRTGLVPYLAAPGYGEMFIEEGFGELVAAARSGAHPRALRDAIPDAMVESIAAVGDASAVAIRLAAYRAAGIDQIAIVPVTADDRTGRRTLEPLA